jgi:hypothetical protein
MIMGEMVDRVAFEMARYEVVEMVDGTFAIEDGYRNVLVRKGLTAADEPMDMAADMNARAAIKAMRSPTDVMAAAGRNTEDNAVGIWQDMIDSALAEHADA